jgi:hypothetical protein
MMRAHQPGSQPLDSQRSRAKILATHFRATVNARALGAFPPAVRFHQGTSRI